MLIILKFLILILILIISILLGNTKAKTYDNRVVELKKIKSSLEMLKTKIEFTYEPIKEIFYEISKTIYSEEDNIFENTNILARDNNLNNAWNIAVDKNKNLLKEDKDTIKLFGKLLGKTDKAGQINEINVTSNLLDTLIEKAESEKSKNYKLFKSLGTVVGIGICIILV